MYFTLMLLSFSIAIGSGLILYFVGPQARHRPKVRKSLDGVWLAMAWSILSIAVLLVIDMVHTSLWVYPVMMVNLIVISVWFRRRQRAQRPAKRV
jgi:hypothetical protein